MRDSILSLICKLRLYPHEFFTYSPFKTYEFRELERGPKFTGKEVVLDIGCGRGLQTVLLAKRCRRAVGIDISMPDIERARRLHRISGRNIDCEFRCTRLEDAHFPNAYFDRIYSFSVLEHIDNYDEVLRECYRILKPNGSLIFSCDALETIEDPSLIAIHQLKYGVEQYFRRSDLQRLLDALGFTHIDIYPIFRSRLARKLFIRSITEIFPGNHLLSVVHYYRLRFAEARDKRSSRGIFLIVRARKQSIDEPLLQGTPGVVMESTL